MAAEHVNEQVAEAGFAAPGHGNTNTHMGPIHVCQDGWEDCAQHEIDAAKLAEESGDPTKATPIRDGRLTPWEKRTCQEYGPTRGGCECVDTCDCRTQSWCNTRRIITKNSLGRDITVPCGDEVDIRGVAIDQCMLTPPPPGQVPQMQFNEPTSQPGVTPRDENGNVVYRAYSEPKNQRFAPKFNCYARKFYCWKFPEFHGCTISGIAYDPHKLDDESRFEMEACEKQKDQNGCNDYTVGSDNPCLWGEDSPAWFRKLRSEQNQEIRADGDPAVSQNNVENGGKSSAPGGGLPVLQPAWGGDRGHGRRVDAPRATPAPTPPSEYYPYPLPW